MDFGPTGGVTRPIDAASDFEIKSAFAQHGEDEFVVG